MKRLERWLRRETRARARRPTLAHALLSNWGFRYARYRLRFHPPRLVVRTFVYFTEAFLLSLVLPFDLISAMLGYRVLMGVATGVAWGGLESLREGVRGHVRERRPHAASRTIEAWLAFVWIGGAAIVAATVAMVTLTPSVLGYFSFIEVYAVACAIRFVIELGARTYHAGIYAVRRVYRPLWSTLVADLVEVGLLAGLYPTLGLQILPISVLVGGLLRAALNYAYVRLAYTDSGIPRPRFGGAVRHVPTHCVPGLTRAALHSLANTTSQLDGLVLMFLFAMPTAARDAVGADAAVDVASEVPLAAAYYVLRPVVALAHGWTRTFYFDFARLHTAFDTFYRLRFRRLLGRVGWLVVGVVAAVTSAVGWALWGVAGISSIAALLLLVAARAKFSILQLEAFCYGQYRYLAGLAAVIVGGLWLASMLAPSELAFLVAASALLMLASAGLGRPAIDDSHRYARGPAAWLRALAEQTEAVTIGIATVDARLASARDVERDLASTIGPEQVSRLGRRLVMWFEPGAAPVLADADMAYGRTGGVLRSCSVFRADPGVGTAVERLLNHPSFPSRTRMALLAEDAPSAASLAAALQAAHPEGTLLTPQSGALRVGPAWPGPQLTDVQHTIRAGAAGQPAHSSRRRTPFDVAVYAPGGRVEWAFAIPNGRLGELRRAVADATLRDSARA